MRRPNYEYFDAPRPVITFLGRTPRQWDRLLWIGVAVAMGALVAQVLL
jgi:hypothetical protein